MMTVFWTAREQIIDQQKRLGDEYVDHVWSERERERRANTPAEFCCNRVWGKWPAQVYDRTWPEKAFERGGLSAPPVVVKLEDRRS